MITVVFTDRYQAGTNAAAVLDALADFQRGLKLPESLVITSLGGKDETKAVPKGRLLSLVNSI